MTRQHRPHTTMIARIAATITPQLVPDEDEVVTFQIVPVAELLQHCACSAVGHCVGAAVGLAVVGNGVGMPVGKEVGTAVGGVGVGVGLIVATPEISVTGPPTTPPTLHFPTSGYFRVLTVPAVTPTQVLSPLLSSPAVR